MTLPKSREEADKMLKAYEWDSLDLPTKQLRNAEQAVEVQKQILNFPIDPDDTKLTSIQADLSHKVINTQLRIDETKLRQQQNDDVLAKVIAAIQEEKSKT